MGPRLDARCQSALQCDVDPCPCSPLVLASRRCARCILFEWTHICNVVFHLGSFQVDMSCFMHVFVVFVSFPVENRPKLCLPALLVCVVRGILPNLPHSWGWCGAAKQQRHR